MKIFSKRVINNDEELIEIPIVEEFEQELEYKIFKNK